MSRSREEPIVAQPRPSAPGPVPNPSKVSGRTVVRFVLIVAALNIAAWLTYELARIAVNGDASQAVFTTRLVTLVVMWACFTVLATRVGYDWLHAAVNFWLPIYALLFTIKVVWRLANIPTNRYWIPSSDTED